MREPLVAWAGDCRVRGEVELGEGRLSDQVNDRDLLTFFDARLEALEDGHEIALDEVEVERRELHIIEVDGRRGDPTRRLRTVEEPVLLEVGPFRVVGNLHRAPNAGPLAALYRLVRFLPVTDARIDVADSTRPTVLRSVILVNRDRIDKTEPLAAIPIVPDPEDVRNGQLVAGADPA